MDELEIKIESLVAMLNSIASVFETRRHLYTPDEFKQWINEVHEVISPIATTLLSRDLTGESPT